MWQWIKSNGDHFLSQVSIFLLGGSATGVLPPGSKWAGLVTVVGAFLHTLLVPDQPAPPSPAPQAK